jgi:trans-2,3-dihydro-3-hydroxyanthranilate isomerase
VLDFHVVDVFTDRPFAGNPLAVVLGAGDLTTGQLLAIAREFHLSETAFPVVVDADRYRVRIFTPDVELPFAGHPSVGTSWLLASLGLVSPGVVVQECAAGEYRLDVPHGRGAPTLHVGAPRVVGEVEPGPLLSAVGLTGSDLAVPLPVLAATAGLPTAFLPVRPDALARCVPDLAALRALAGDAAWENLSVLAWDAQERVARTRVFCASLGIPEDPATGSAAAAFAAWVVAAGAAAVDRTTTFTVVQGVELGRPSRIEGTVTCRGGAAVDATVSGGVVPVSSGRIVAPDP